MQVENKLRESEGKYRLLTEVTNDVIYTIDVKGIITHISPQISRYGYKPKEILSKNFTEFIAEEDAANVIADFKKTISTRQPTITILRIRDKTGNLHWMEDNGAPVFDSSGIVVAVSGILRDITQRKRVENDLKERLKERNCLFNISALMELPVKSLDEIFKRTVMFLPPARQFPEITEACIVIEGQQFKTTGFRDTSWMLSREIIVNGSPVGRVQVCYLEERPSSDEGPFMIDERQLLNAIAERLGRIIERKLAEDALHQANKRLSLFSSVTRHDINNQLTILEGYLRIMEKKKPDPVLTEYLQKAKNSAQRISSIILFTKTYESIGSNAPVWQNFHTIVKDTAKDAVLGNVLLINDIPANEEVYADPLITKVFYNLIDNAVRYGGKITTIRFSVEKRNGSYVVVCEDDGDGIPQEDKERIFEKGFGKNTGMGLFLAREILSITDIIINETGDPGKGAKFEIMIPKDAYRFADHRSEIKNRPKNGK